MSEYYKTQRRFFIYLESEIKNLEITDTKKFIYQLRKKWEVSKRCIYDRLNEMEKIGLIKFDEDEIKWKG